MQKEWFEWISSWCDSSTQNDLPRILLVGDSISRGYQDKVRAPLKGVCYVDYISLSYAIDTPIYNTIIEKFAADSNYALIHFNHGLHGIHMSQRTYKSRLKKLLCKLEKSSKIMLAASTFVYEGGNKKPHKKWNKRVNERNAAMQEICKEQGYGYNDLFALSKQMDIALRDTDGTHYVAEGYAVLAEQVAMAVKNAL